MVDLQFFFSYARATAETSVLSAHPDRNCVREFFGDLCNRVAGLTGKPAAKVGYMDSSNLALSAPWPKELVKALSAAPVMVTLVCPSYLRSENCGREIHVFEERFKALSSQGGNPPHPIFPIYWEALRHCHRHIPKSVEELFVGYNFTDPDFPEEYPSVGVNRIKNLDGEKYKRLVFALADRIVDYIQTTTLPPFVGPDDFRVLPSAFAGGADGEAIKSGVGAANVVYWVPTRAEADAEGLPEPDQYAQRQEDWQPFRGSNPGATIRHLTEQGLNQAGCGEVGHWLFPPDLNAELEAANARQAAVLMVLDGKAARVARYRASMAGYDTRNYANVGLVAAAGDEDDSMWLRDALPFKHGTGLPAHLWTVPPDHGTYVDNVRRVVIEVRGRMMRQALGPGGRGASMPGLAGPSGRGA